MSATINGEFYLGETWIFQGVVRDHRAVPINLAGATVRLRISTAKRVTVLDLSTPSGGSVLNANSGTYEFVINRATQVSANVTPGAYSYEIKVDFPGDRSSVQNDGTIRVLPSLFET